MDENCSKHLYNEVNQKNEDYRVAIATATFNLAC